MQSPSAAAPPPLFSSLFTLNSSKRSPPPHHRRSQRSPPPHARTQTQITAVRILFTRRRQIFSSDTAVQGSIFAAFKLQGSIVLRCRSSFKLQGSVVPGSIFVPFKLQGPVTIADQTAEESMVSIILENLPSHAIYGEENGWRCKEKFSDYVWVLDPIDGTKSFITGKPVFGTLIALLQRGKPILGIIDQPILKERWIGISGRKTTLNGQEVSTRNCTNLSQAYLYTTSPHLFSEKAEEAFTRVRNKVKVPLYGCDCYAYALLASGFVDLVVESGLKPYDFLSLIPVIEGAGGVITDWEGHQLCWEASPNSVATSFNVLAAGDKQIHQQALESLQWQ